MCRPSLESALEVPRGGGGTNLVLGSLKATGRALWAMIRGEVDSEASLVQQCVQRLQNMWNAAFAVDTDEDSTVDEDDDATTTDAGDSLANKFRVSRDNHGTIVHGGSFADALKMARSQARLLVVLIPNKADKAAVTSFLSSDVAAVAERKARKASETEGSFLLWSPISTAQAKAALSKLKVTQKGNKSVLLVAHGKQVLAQHHCSPPPSSTAMATWLNALRKRHGSLYQKLERQVKEAQWYAERQQGYQQSMQDDVDRQDREARQEAERLALEAAEKERQQAILDRRDELREALGEEPTKGDLKTIALRLADGRSVQRKFTSDSRMEDVFNFVDVHFEMEREKVELTTMNGKSTYQWEDNADQTLTEAGLSRMVGLRVLERKDAEVQESVEQ